MKKIDLIALSIVTMTVLTACGSTSTTAASTESKKISGDISGNGYAKNDVLHKLFNNIITPAYAAGINDPDTIVVLYGEDSKEFAINADGTFEIDTDLLNENNLVILVVNKANKKVFGHLNLGTSSSAKLDFFDKSKLTENLDLGTVDTENNCTSTTTLTNSTAFSSEEISKLEQVAIADDAMVLAVNNFLSPNFGTEVLSYMSLGTKAEVTNQFNNLTNFNRANNFIKNSFGFSGQDNSWQSVAEGNVQIYPPVAVNYKSSFQDNGFSGNANSNTPIISNHRNITPGDNGAFFQFPAIDTFPEGNWKAKIAGSTDTVAEFVFAGADAFDSAGKPKVPVPTMKIITDGNGIVQSLEIKWYLYSNGTYVEASEELLNSLTSQTEGKVLAEYRVGQSNENHYIRYGSDTQTWNTVIDLSSENIDIADMREIFTSFSIGQANYKYGVN